VADPFLFYVILASLLFPPITGVIRYKRLSREFRVLFFFFFIGALYEFVQVWMAKHGINNLWTSHIYHAGEFVVFMWVLAIWEERPRIKRLMVLSISIYLVLWVILKFTFNPIMEGVDTLALPVHIVFTILSIRLLHVLVEKERSLLLTIPRFWFLAGLLIYSSGDLVMYALSSVIEQLPIEIYGKVWQYHWLVDSIANILFAAGFLGVLKGRRPLKSRVQRSGVEELSPGETSHS